MADKKPADRRDGGSHQEDRGPSVFPSRPDTPDRSAERDPEEEGSAGKTQR
jgi:hypothetical protein